MYFLANAASEGGTSCGGVEVLKIIEFIFKLLQIVLFIVPIILIVMIIIDLAKAVIAGKEDDMKRNQKLAIKRVIMCIAMFLVNAFVSVSMSLVKDTPNYKSCIEQATGKSTSEIFGEPKDIK